MSLNSSSSDASLHPLLLSSSFMDYFLSSCMTSTVGIFNITSFTFISILLLLPLCVFVLYLGLQRWRQQRSGSMTSHSDVFTYNMILRELGNMLGSVLCCCGTLADLPQMGVLSLYLIFINFVVQLLFHILTCVECHLAVVHPVTYRGLRKAKGIPLRNVAIGCVWLLSCAATGFMSLDYHIFLIILGSLALVTITVICFCSVSVLCALIGPGPGQGGGVRQRVDQSKLRAFYTIVTILGVLLVRFGWDIMMSALHGLPHLSQRVCCGLLLSDLWFSLPSSLVLPLLFLHRAGKLPCWRNSNNPGRGPG